MTEQTVPKQPFVAHWPNAVSRENYLLHAREFYAVNREAAKASFQGHVDYSKWLLASLLAVNGGSIYAIANLQPKIVDQSHLLIYAVAVNMLSIILTLACGGMTWKNFQDNERFHGLEADPATLYRDDMFDKPQTKIVARKMTRSYRMAIGLAIAALIGFSISCGFVLAALFAAWDAGG